jgi:hypothetical protein
MKDTTTLYCLAAIYIALTESIRATSGVSVEPLAERLIKDMLPQMPPEAAEICAQLIKHATSNARIPQETVTLTAKVLH